MPNQHVLSRLDGIKSQLMAGYASGAMMSASSKGSEREEFVEKFLSKVFPPHYRFGRGDVTDQAGNKSGQLDVVIEYPFGPSLPAVGSDNVRLYLAETTAVAIEVKSDMANQWSEVARTSEQLAKIQRRFGAMFTTGQGRLPGPSIPLIVVGFNGWSKPETLREHVDSTPGICGALVVDSGLWVLSSKIGYGHADGAAGLWAMICYVNEELRQLGGMSSDNLRYIFDPN